MMIEIEDLREVELQDDNSGDDREVNGTENYRDIIVTREGNEAATYDEMATLYTDSIYLYMDRFEIPIGSSTAAYYEAAESLMLDELAAKNITSVDAIDRMKEQLAKYITATLGNVFYNDDDDDLWGMCIQYNTTSGNFDNNPLYNGNISEIHWKNKFDEEKRGYGFQYDQLERMKQAEYKANHNGAWIADLNHYNEFGINYDANGNIQTLKRTGFDQNNQFGTIDDLLYQYQGNQLTSVHDAVITSANGYGNFDFTDGAFLATEYVYDANGNMITDHNKEVSGITYNHLDLPEHITFVSGKSIQFIYDVDGNLHHKITDDANGNLSNSYYDGSFHYGEQELDFILTSEGRIVPPSNSVDNYHRYEYHYRDHQNNMRLAYSDLDGDNKINPQTEVLEIGDYYPFGMRQKGHQNPQWQQIGAAHVFTFQNQLKHEEFGWNVSQYRWRNVMPDLGRFFNVDPLAEEYTKWSPYSFSGNQIIHTVELEGLEPLDDLKAEDYKVMQQHLKGQDIKNYVEATIDGAAFFISNFPDLKEQSNCDGNCTGHDDNQALGFTFDNGLTPEATLLNNQTLENGIRFVGGGLTIASTLSGAGSLLTNASKKAVSYTANQLGNMGETALRKTYGGAKKTFKTSQGTRFVDNFAEGVAHEAKVGYKSATKFIKKQFAKDLELLGNASSGVKEVVWTFYKSPQTGKAGASKQLLELFEQAQKLGYNIRTQ